MKIELRIEESAKLIDLGIDKSKASKELIENICQAEYSEPRPRVFTLTDILSILPQEIESDDVIYGLNLWVDSAVWHVEYCSEQSPYDCLHGTDINAPELIDTLYQLLIWAIENGYVYIKTDKQ